MDGVKRAVNRNYKDSVFVDFFGQDETAASNFLSLYNALHGTHLDNSTVLKPLRLEQVMYMTFYNDVSYLIDNKMIVLVEHQSTINPNMPIRCLEYVVRLYEQLLNAQERYARKPIKIPTPEFYVFYNGLEDYPNEAELRLSEAFISREKEASLELTVRVLNINKRKGNKILQNCQPLEEYSLFVEAVRQHIEQDKADGFEKAIKECMQKGILKEYLQRKSREVINMLLAEYDYATDIAVQRKESFDMGLEQGKHESKFETARILKRLGNSVQTIVQATGLSKEDIDKL